VLDVLDKGRETHDHPHPLLFVHGAFQGAWCWDVNFLDFFAERGFRVVALSFRGHGSSTVGKPLRLCSISDFVGDVASVAGTLKWPILVGHSMGGFVVQKYLQEHDAPAAVLLASVPPHGHLPALLRLIRRYPWRSSKFALTGSPRDMTGGTVAGARELFFGDKASDTLLWLRPASGCNEKAHGRSSSTWLHAPSSSRPVSIHRCWCSAESRMPFIPTPRYAKPREPTELRRSSFLTWATR
jgi:pimeloyl-ACP methyl ester carboxylesterase